ncbi:hypothetical protein LCGC14_2377060 [marine sediment metagenome]|uniref:peptidylprolyl isomerase n=1 Tax=marine sediment metagenome TaxID=412755 RepID=A0A0F9EEH9_9ZZZZ
MSIDNILELELKDGIVTIEMLSGLAPKHVARIKHMAKEEFYDGLTFHRVIDGFMAQGGCPKGDGTGATTTTLTEEFSDEPHVRGICSMARGVEVDSASCQFFIVLADSPHLDKQYTAWGRVISGMEFVDNIKKGDPAKGGIVEDPDKIVSMSLMADKEIKIV